MMLVDCIRVLGSSLCMPVPAALDYKVALCLKGTKITGL